MAETLRKTVHQPVFLTQLHLVDIEFVQSIQDTEALLSAGHRKHGEKRKTRIRPIDVKFAQMLSRNKRKL